MEKFLKRKAPSSSSSDNDLDDLPWDPADRKKIADYHPNQRDEVIRKYSIRGPCQPRGHVFEQKTIGNTLRRFNPAWFDQYSDWLEYSVKKERAFCFFCYLFRDNAGKSVKSDAFITYGFSSWNKFRKSFSEHVGGVNSFHNSAAMKCENLMKQFNRLSDLGELARTLVETRKHMSYPLVYRLLKLILILPVATATVERCFSAMKIIKTDRRNRIGDQFLNDCMVCYIEKDIFETITNETVIKIFQDMKDRRVVL